MNLQDRITAFAHLGEYLNEEFAVEQAEKLIVAKVNKQWFTIESIKKAISAWSDMLTDEMLAAWLSPYKLSEVESPKRVLIIMAGNIPLVGFHDFLSVVISGHKVVVKLSSNDNILIPIIIKKLIEIVPEFSDYIEFIDDVKNRKFDAVIATGSDNSAQYF